MCTQELYWCRCGHGEFFPIVKCASADILGTCWIVVHGDKNTVLDCPCTYCAFGMNDCVALSANVRPDADRDEKMMEAWKKEGGEVEFDVNMSEGLTRQFAEEAILEEKDLVPNQTAQEENHGTDDQSATQADLDFLGSDLWQYVGQEGG